MREGTKGAVAPPICAPRGRGGWQRCAGGTAAGGTGLRRGAWPGCGRQTKRCPGSVFPACCRGDRWPGRTHRDNAGALGPVSSQADIPPGAWVMRIGGRPGWPLRTVDPPPPCPGQAALLPSQPSCDPLTDLCHPSGCCFARCRTWQRPCTAAGQAGPLAQIFHDSAVARRERKPSSSKACIDLSELACQPMPTLAKSGLLKRVDVSFISAQNSTKPYGKRLE